MGCVTIKLTEDLNSKKLTSISMMSFCLKCQIMTPSVVMQKDTWCVSFGKYLEMRFHGHAYRRRQLSAEESNEKSDSESGATPECTHSINSDHVHYFTFNGIVASVMYTQIETWEIYLPSLHIQLENALNMSPSVTAENAKSLSTRGHEVYATVYDRLAQTLGDVTDPLLNNLKQMVNNDQLHFKEQMNLVQTQLTENKVDAWMLNDAFVVAKRTLAESIETWNHRLTDAAIQCKALSSGARGDSAGTIVPSAHPPSTLQLQRPPFVDAGTVCTEELRSDIDSPTQEVEPPFSREISHETDDKHSAEASSGDYQARPSGDKKSVKNRLLDLLPSEKNVQYSIPSPLSSNEHHTLPLGSIPVTVHDQDLSSIIAYSLISVDYHRILDSLHFCEAPRKSVDAATDSEEREKEKDKEGESKERRPSKSTAHVEINFQDASAQFMCKIYFARNFDAMRANCLSVTNDKAKVDSEQNKSQTLDSHKKQIESIRTAFARSLCQSVQWEARGGKSGSKFCKTLGKCSYWSPHFKCKVMDLLLFFFR